MPIVPLPGTPPLPPAAEGWCGWDVEPVGLCPSWDTLTVEQQTTALRLATLVMWSSTGRRYGPCELTLRPCQTKEWGETYRAFPAWWSSPQYGVGWFPVLNGGEWTNCGCGTGCCCRVKCEVILPGPVTQVREVLVHGELVPANQYIVQVAEGSYRLVRTMGGCWPTCQSFDQLANGTDAFSVRYTRGQQVPPSVIDATSILACEFGKQIAGVDCGLPPRLQSLTRQGVSADFVSQSALDISVFPTGINLVDMVIRSENPARRQRPPAVMSPDVEPVRDRITVIGEPS